MASLVLLVLYDKACDANCVNYESLKAMVINITSAKQMKHRQGQGTSTTDGLSVSQGYINGDKDKKRTYSVNQVQIEEDHSVSQTQPERTNAGQNQRGRGYFSNFQFSNTLG